MACVKVSEDTGQLVPHSHFLMDVSFKLRTKIQKCRSFVLKTAENGRWSGQYSQCLTNDRVIEYIANFVYYNVHSIGAQPQVICFQ